MPNYGALGLAADAANAQTHGGIINKASGLAGLLGGPLGMLAGPVLGAVGGLLAPNPYKQKEKADAKAQARKIGAVNANLRPQQARYNLSRNLPEFDDILKKLVLGSAAKKFGSAGNTGAKDMGIDFNYALAKINERNNPWAPETTTMGDANRPAGLAPQGMPINYGGGGPGAGKMRPPDVEGPEMYAGALMRKYGMER
jgi:hypothetical protein